MKVERYTNRWIYSASNRDKDRQTTIRYVGRLIDIQIDGYIVVREIETKKGGQIYKSRIFRQIDLQIDGYTYTQLYEQQRQEGQIDNYKICMQVGRQIYKQIDGQIDSYNE